MECRVVHHLRQSAQLHERLEDANAAAECYSLLAVVSHHMGDSTARDAAASEWQRHSRTASSLAAAW